jgi:hypothetical protein
VLRRPGLATPMVRLVLTRLRLDASSGQLVERLTSGWPEGLLAGMLKLGRSCLRKEPIP